MRKRWIAQGMILPAVLFWVSAASAQYVKGTREASKAFFRGDEEVDFVVRLDNPGAAAKSITVVGPPMIPMASGCRCAPIRSGNRGG